eukprot:Skav225992  [mRNA]  locus=scaffold4003:161449:163482:+ [translate_table: standard]
MKRGAIKPLLDIETHPGEAIKWALSIPHPFTVEDPLPGEVLKSMEQFKGDLAPLIDRRTRSLAWWKAQAHRLLPLTDQHLRQLKDPYLRHLLRGVPDHKPAQLGITCHIELYRAMARACGSVDSALIDEMLNGMTIVGPIGRSQRWPPYEKEQKPVEISEVLRRAWALRETIVRRVQGVPVSGNLQKIWDATIEDRDEGSCLGPFFSFDQVSKVVMRDDWIPTQRFEVVQKNKVRGCDSATTNMINQATVITEKLQLPSTDMNVAALRKLRSIRPESQLWGWVLDERKAYRQLPIRPDHRMFSVIALKDPHSGRVAFFVMVGHSFGLVSAVYNYNRRSALINEFLCSLFGLVAFNFYDDKYGFEFKETIASAHEIAQAVHWWLGARYDQKKLQLSSEPVILGVTYNLESMILEIKSDRKRDLLEEIEAILSSGLLDPGSAGKLKGKLMFGASQLWGKVGRAFLRPISERQYSRSPHNGSFSLDQALRVALVHWKGLINEGPPRTIDLKVSKRSDVVIFTDGFTSDPRDRVKKPDRVGAVLFDPRLKAPVQFSEVIPPAAQKRWLIRNTQIVPIEMMAPILAIETFRDRLRNTDLILLIDSESVEAALVKGYSSREDLCDLISVFWDLVIKYQIRVFIDRVSTDANPADWPSRGDLERGERAGWVTVKSVWPKDLSKA